MNNSKTLLNSRKGSSNQWQENTAMLAIKLPQVSYSETVVRKALYWCDHSAMWALEPIEGNWVISVKQPATNFETTLHKHLNDFLLRERLDAQTRSLREELINASLRAVMLNVSKA